MFLKFIWLKLLGGSWNMKLGNCFSWKTRKLQKKWRDQNKKSNCKKIKMPWIFKGCLWNTELENWFSWQNRSRLWEKTDLAEKWFSQKKWFQQKYKIPTSNSNKYFWYFFSEKLILDLCNSDRFGWEIVLTWTGSWEAGRLEHKILINQIVWFCMVIVWHCMVLSRNINKLRKQMAQRCIALAREGGGNWGERKNNIQN